MRKPPAAADLPTLLAWIMETRGWAEQEELAAAIGVDQGTVSKWMGYRRHPRRSVWGAIADAGGIDIIIVGQAVARTTLRPTPLSRNELEAENRRLRARLAAYEPPESFNGEERQEDA